MEANREKAIGGRRGRRRTFKSIGFLPMVSSRFSRPLDHFWAPSGSAEQRAATWYLGAYRVDCRWMRGLAYPTYQRRDL